MVLFQDELGNALMQPDDKDHYGSGMYEPLTHSLRLLETLIRTKLFLYEISEKKGEKIHVITSKRISRDKLELRNNAKHQQKHRLTTNQSSKGLSKVFSKEEVRVQKSDVRSQMLDKEKYIKRKFEPPTVQEVQAYAQSIGFDLDAEKFCAHYGAANWIRGKTKITNWKLCVVTWKRNHIEKSTEIEKVPSWM